MSLELPAVLILLGLQLTAFAWRVVREIRGDDPVKHPWVPVPDNINLAAAFAVAWWCVLIPLMQPVSPGFVLAPFARAVFAAAVVLLIAHPIVVAAHYRLWDGEGRGINMREATEHPYCTRQEGLLQLIALAAAITVAFLVLRGNG